MNGPAGPGEGCPKLTSYFELTSYFGERQRTAGSFTADALLDLYAHHRIARPASGSQPGTSW